MLFWCYGLFLWLQHRQHPLQSFLRTQFFPPAIFSDAEINLLNRNVLLPLSHFCPPIAEIFLVYQPRLLFYATGKLFNRLSYILPYMATWVVLGVFLDTGLVLECKVCAVGKNMTLLRCELCFMSLWLLFDRPNLHTWNPSGGNQNSISIRQMPKYTKYIVLYMNR